MSQTMPVTSNEVPSLARLRDDQLARVGNVRHSLESMGVDALVGYSVSNQPGPVGYLAGYEPKFGLHDVAAALVLPDDEGHAMVFTNAFWDEVESTMWPARVEISGDPAGAIISSIPETVKRLGVAGYRFFPAGWASQIAKARPDLAIVDVTGVLQQIAMIKSPLEVSLVRRAMAITDMAIESFLDECRPGVNEIHLQRSLEERILTGGADGLAFPTLLFSGDHVPRGIGFARNRGIEAGEQVAVVCGAMVRGYRVDLGRTVLIGDPSDAELEAQEAATALIDVLRESAQQGASIGQMASSARSAAEEIGVADWLYQSPNEGAVAPFGHGIGCWYQEAPMGIVESDPTTLESGMVLVLEARLGRDDVAGAVVTEPVLITESGAVGLSETPLRTW